MTDHLKKEINSVLLAGPTSNPTPCGGGGTRRILLGVDTKECLFPARDF